MTEQTNTNADTLNLLRAASLLTTYCTLYNIAIRHGSVDYLAELNKAVETVERGLPVADAVYLLKVAENP